MDNTMHTIMTATVYDKLDCTCLEPASDDQIRVIAPYGDFLVGDIISQAEIDNRNGRKELVRGIKLWYLLTAALTDPVKVRFLRPRRPTATPTTPTYNIADLSRADCVKLINAALARVTELDAVRNSQVVTSSHRQGEMYDPQLYSTRMNRAQTAESSPMQPSEQHANPQAYRDAQQRMIEETKAAFAAAAARKERVEQEIVERRRQQNNTVFDMEKWMAARKAADDSSFFR